MSETILQEESDDTVEESGDTERALVDAGPLVTTQIVRYLSGLHEPIGNLPPIRIRTRKYIHHAHYKSLAFEYT